MLSSKLASYLGLCMRAGGLESGAVAAKEALRHGRCKLLVVDSAMSDSECGRYGLLCRAHDVTLLKATCDVGEAIGKPDRRVLAITDAAWVDPIIRANLAESMNS